jgi:adenosylcobyric acid synthase
MLGRSVADPLGIEGPPSHVEGLGLLDIETRLSPAKVLRHVTGTALGARLTGYEMHMGETAGLDTARPFATLDQLGPEGGVSSDGTVLGTYLHGLLASSELRTALLAKIAVTGSGRDHAADVHAALDAIADELERHVAVDVLLELAMEKR